jgi:hypothetical protein
MAGLTSKLTRVLVGTALGAGAVGVILALAGVHSAVRTGLVLFFLAVGPVAAIAGLLRSFDLFARLILAVVSTIALLSIVAVILLSAGLWSPTGELVAVGVITVGCLVARLPSVQGRIAAWAGAAWRALLPHLPGVPAAGLTAEPTAPVAVTGNGQAAPAPHAADADADAATVANGQPSPDTAETAGPTEVTTPLPAIRD